MGRRSRRRERAQATGTEPKHEATAAAEGTDAQAGEASGPKQRPRAITIGAIVALLIAVANAVAAFLGGTGGGRSSIPFTVLQCGLLLAVAVGMWKMRYWAVLGLQTVLAIQIILSLLFLAKATNPLAIAAFVAVIAASAALFWSLVRALPRVGLPDRPSRRPRD